MVSLYEFTSHGGRSLGHWGVPWLTPAINALIPVFWFTLKILMFLYGFIWIRATLPRLRYDMLMKFGWQGILPIALVNILLVAVGITFNGFIAFAAWAVIFIISAIVFARSKPSQLFTTNSRRGSTIRLYSDAQPYRANPDHAGRGGQTLPSDAHIGGFATPTTDRERAEVDAALTGKEG